jgi:hypothetical protein
VESRGPRKGESEGKAWSDVGKPFIVTGNVKPSGEHRGRLDRACREPTIASRVGKSEKKGRRRRESATSASECEQQWLLGCGCGWEADTGWIGPRVPIALGGQGATLRSLGW